MDYGGHIKAARKSAGLTQKQLAERLGISFVNISQLENNQRIPNITTLQRIADALGIHIFDLIGIGKNLDKLKVEVSGIKPTAGNTLSLEEIAALKEEIANADPRAEYDSLSDESKKGFWKIFTDTGYLNIAGISSSQAELDKAFNKLNDQGKAVAIERVEELTEIPRYRRQDVPETPADASGDTDTPAPPKGSEEPPEGEEQ